MQAESLPQSWLMVTTVVRQPYCCFHAANGVTADRKSSWVWMKYEPSSAGRWGGSSWLAYGQSLLRVAPKFELKDLEKLFRVKVLAMLLRKEKITREVIRMLDGWRHSGFNVFACERIQPRQKKSLENLAAYLIRATFSQKRMEYSPEQATVVYRSKDGKDRKTYDPLEWLAAMACHVPERGKQTIRYYGAYANSARGRERKRQQVEPIPTVLEPVISSEAFRRNWARLIQKV